MARLLKQTEENEFPWSSGHSFFWVCHQISSWRVPVAVKCMIGSLKEADFALLDTGAEWSVIGGDTAADIQDELGAPIESFRMSTRMGSIDGSLHHVNITLEAGENSGNDLTVESTVFVSEDWEGPAVLGYRGFLERIRFALDPGISPGEQIFYFGLAE
jgi:hypothetical protein